MFAKFVVTGKGPVNHNGVAKKQGDIIELTRQQARALNHLVEPHDDEAKAMVQPDVVKEVRIDGMRPHEQVSILKDEEQRVQEQLEEIRRRRAAAEQAAEARAAARRPAVPREVEAPQPAVDSQE